MGALGQHQMILAAVLALGDGLGVGHAVIVVLAHKSSAQKLLDGGGQVHVIVEARGGLSLCPAGPLDYHGYMAGGLVGGAVLGVEAQLAQVLAVVRGDYDGCVLIQPLLLQPAHNLPDIVVGIAYAAVIAVHKVPHILHGPHRAGMAGELLEVGIIPHIDLIRPMRPHMQQVLGEYLLVYPAVRQGHILEWVAELLRRAVRCVWVPVVHVHEPVVLLALALQPV